MSTSTTEAEVQTQAVKVREEAEKKAAAEKAVLEEQAKELEVRARLADPACTESAATHSCVYDPSSDNLSILRD